MDWIALLVAILVVYLFGSMIGIGLALIKLTNMAMDDSIGSYIQRMEIVVMWTFAWPFCLYQWWKHRDETI
jgi:hypothetical protein